MDNPFQSPVILSLCTGMRGLERGLERAIGPVRTAAYVEIEAFAIWNLVKQMEKGVLAPAPIWSNLKTFPYKEFYGKIHGFIGGYPCQPFSVIGNQQGELDPRHLWPFIKEGFRSTRPIWGWFENVVNHLNIGYETVKLDLEEMGYRVEEGIFSAEEIGAPHRRERLFFLAVDHSRCEGLQRYSRNVNRTNWGGGHRLDQLARQVYFQHTEDNGNMIGNVKGLLNPAWVLQLMGTTLEKTFCEWREMELLSKLRS